MDKLREMLVLEAKDKEYLLGRISKITKGGNCHLDNNFIIIVGLFYSSYLFLEWQYNLLDGRCDLYDPYKMMPSYNHFGN